MDATYSNRLKALFDNPGAIAEDPGFQFIRDQGIEAAKRNSAASGLRYSGNALAELMKLGTGLAAQSRGAEIDRLGRLVGQEQQYDLGQETNRLTGIRDANTLALGRESNDINRTRVTNDFNLGDRRLSLDTNRLGLDTRTAAQNYDINGRRIDADLSLGHEANANNAQRNWWDYEVNRDRNNLTAADQQNRWNIDNRRVDIERFDADTRRGTARSGDWWRGYEATGGYRPRGY